MEEQTVTMPMLGDSFPEMTVQTSQGVMTLPNDYAGRWLVLFSHPGDFSPVCTTEFYALQKHLKQFHELNTELVGLSLDQTFSHIKWKEWMQEQLGDGFAFPVIADVQGNVARRLNLLHPKKKANTIRAVYIVDPQGTVRLINLYPHELGRNTEEILRSVRALQASAANGGPTPANWPQNELLGDKIIIPPAADEATARENMKTYEHYDWWFCYKDRQ